MSGERIIPDISDEGRDIPESCVPMNDADTSFDDSILSLLCFTRENEDDVKSLSAIRRF